MSRDSHAARSQTREKEPNSDFVVANFEKQTAAGTLHALTELQELSQKDPKNFAKMLAKVNERVDTSFLAIDKDGKSRGDLEIVGFDKCGSLIMKDKSTDTLFDPKVNLKNGILEITRPLNFDVHKCAPLHIVGTESPEIRALARPEKPVDPDGKTEDSAAVRQHRPVKNDYSNDKPVDDRDEAASRNDIPALRRPLKAANEFQSSYDIPAQFRPIKAYGEASFDY